ncbi:MAG TPA: hypothetical protein VHV57_19615 [Acidimicrobiales bacterium]|nr:hypothetical protein [Acidimicrobiales bacterium]
MSKEDEGPPGRDGETRVEGDETIVLALLHAAEIEPHPEELVQLVAAFPLVRARAILVRQMNVHGIEPAASSSGEIAAPRTGP